MKFQTSLKHVQVFYTLDIQQVKYQKYVNSGVLLLLTRCVIYRTPKTCLGVCGRVRVRSHASHGKPCVYTCMEGSITNFVTLKCSYYHGKCLRELSSLVTDCYFYC